MASKNRPNGFWNRTRIFIEARKYRSKGEFSRNCSAAYSAACDKGILQEVTAHMPKRKRRPPKWTPELVTRESARYSSSKEFQLRAPRAYRAAIRLGIIGTVTGHMARLRVSKGHWTEERIKAIAAEFRTPAEFRKGSPQAYGAAHRLRILDQACAHMLRFKHPDWTQTEIAAEALKYSSRSDFERMSRGAYKAAHRRGLLDVFCAHMQRKGNRFRRGIYIYEFEDKSAYIGLTCDYERRHRQHMLFSKRIVDKVKLFKYNLIRNDRWFSPDEAVIEEARLIQSYLQQGWEVLNVAKAGSIGGSYLIWTPEALAKEVQKYQTLAEFQSQSRGAYHAAWKSGILESLSKGLRRLKRPNGAWTRDAVLQEARKYLERTVFRTQSPGAFQAACRLRILEESCRHMRVLLAPKGTWTRDRILEKASGCPDRTAFQRRYPGAYDAAMRMRMLPEIHKMIPRRYKKALWTEERLEKEAQKYSRRGEFKKKSPSAYVMAGRKGIREKICRHMCTA